jgi:nucleotide-binding universal stress UspA family protein
MHTRLLIPLDGSKTAESALAFIPVLLDAGHVPIELLTVVDISQMMTHLIGDKARYLDKLIAEAERTNGEYLGKIANKVAEFDVKWSVERGKPADIIIEKATANAGTLIVMATHGRSGINRWLLGSVAEKVLRGSSNPLFLARAGNHELSVCPPSLRSLIVPLDGSSLAESILPTTVEMAKRLDAEIVVFRAFELPASAYYGSENFLPNYDELTKQVKAEALSYLDGQAEELRAKGVARVTPIVSEGLAADEIIRFANERPNSLLALCTHGRSGVQRWVLGSVTETVIRHTTTPALVLHALTDRLRK